MKIENASNKKNRKYYFTDTDATTFLAKHRKIFIFYFLQKKRQILMFKTINKKEKLVLQTSKI